MLDAYYNMSSSVDYSKYSKYIYRNNRVLDFVSVRASKGYQSPVPVYHFLTSSGAGARTRITLSAFNNRRGSSANLICRIVSTAGSPSS